jgi:outer membrane protein OmpA-like peptidoglycan-associated protein
MDERKTPAPRIASRTAVMVAVAVLIVIAIAGIVLASLRRAGPADVATSPDSTQASAPALTGAAPTATAEDGKPNEVIFDATSDQLSAGAQAKMSVLAAKAKKDARTVVVKAQIEANAQRVQSMDLAKRRAFNVRTALTNGGVSLGMMRIEVTELPNGLLPPSAAHRVEVDLR